MRISKALFASAICVVLAACDGGFEFGGFGRKAPEKIQLPDGTIVAGAEGWCIDEATSRTGSDTVVVVLGSCAAIAGNDRLPRPQVPGLVTVSVEAEAGDLPDGETLQKFFVSEAGRAALARDGDAESVDILDTRLQDGLLYLHAADSSAAPGASNEVWRALFGLEGRFVAVSFYTRLEDEIAAEDGLATLEAQVAELKAANQG